MAVTQRYTPFIKMTAADDQIDGYVDIEYLHLVAKAAIAGDDFEFQDGFGNTIWKEVADGANFSKIHVVKHRVWGFKIVTLDTAGAELYVNNDTYRDWSQRGGKNEKEA